MEPFEQDELSQQELNDLLKEWQAPAPPRHLRTALFPEISLPWWRRLWTASIRVPLPVACCLALLLAVAVWRVALPPSPLPVPPAVLHTQSAEPPVEPERASVPRQSLTFNELRPVAELRPRIIRSQNAKN
jgi:hypothetical protein